MSNKFKVGDRIRCIDATINGGITNGKKYTVEETVPGLDLPGLVYIQNDSHQHVGYFSSRFELVPRVEQDLTQLDYTSLLGIRDRVNRELRERDYAEERRHKTDVTRGEFEDLKAAVNADK